MTPQSSTCSMKDSGIEWVGQVPSHWSVRPFYSFAAEVDHPNTGLKERNGFYPEITDGCKRVENFWSCLATLRRILGLWNRSMYSNTSALAASSVG